MVGMIELEGGIELPRPARAAGITRFDDVNQRRWDKMKWEVWQRCYTHCLFSLHALFGTELHTLVPAMAKKMLEADQPMLVALRFMGELELQGYVRIITGFNKRTVEATRKLLKLKICEVVGPDSAVTMPRIVGKDYLSTYIAVRGGIRSHENIRTSAVVKRMAQEQFTVNRFVQENLEKYPKATKDIVKSCMYQRTIASAKVLEEEAFRFPYFLDSRSRMYVTTTCGVSPQGADHEKALLIPSYAQVLSEVGYAALLEATEGYSEQEWSVEQMWMHASEPGKYVDEWHTADKPFCYLANAKLIAEYHIDKNRPLPAFIPLDGRCSGLQHWSALTRSNAITRHIGMHEEAHDLDIYEYIADKWKQTLPDDKKHYATRKAAKIPVMTWGYNAKMVTSADHMASLFGATSYWDVDEEKYVYKDDGLERAETFQLGKEVYESLNETLGELSEAVGWVSDAAATIAKAGNVDIEWITPDGFNCVQRKVAGVKKVLACKLSNGEEFQLQIKDFSERLPCSRKHRSAIAPNIIHSLDATHLRMVARKMDLLGIPMVFIHDSFATHVNYRPELYRLIVDCFIELYSRNYMQELKVYWEAKYEVDLGPVTGLGDWTPESMVNLEKFFV